MFESIQKPVGRGGLNDPLDVRKTKQNLKKVGDWNPYYDLYDHPTSEPEKTFETAIEGFQGRFGLKKDGALTPGGPTETTLRAEAAREDREEAGLPKASAPLKLKAPVGTGQSNQPADVSAVQSTFNTIAHPTLGLGPLLGAAGNLQTFQSKFGLKSDGIMLPGGPTEAKLNQLAGPILANNRSLVHASEGAQFVPIDGHDHGPKTKCERLRGYLKTVLSRIEVLKERLERENENVETKKATYKKAVDDLREAKATITQPGHFSDVCEGLKNRRWSIQTELLYQTICKEASHSAELKLLKELSVIAHQDLQAAIDRRQGYLDRLEKAEANADELRAEILECHGSVA